jgi:hypothetical protein
MLDPMRAFSRTFRWSDGTSTDGYAGVEVDDEGLSWFRWSHHHQSGGRLDEGRQSFAELLRNGPTGTPPAHVLTELTRLARERG